MEMIGRAFRGFFNLTASGVLLLIGVLLFFGALQTPADSQAWKENGPTGAIVILLLALFSAFLTYGFYRQGSERRTWLASSVLSALAALALFSVFGMWMLHHF